MTSVTQDDAMVMEKKLSIPITGSSAGNYYNFACTLKLWTFIRDASYVETEKVTVFVLPSTVNFM